MSEFTATAWLPPLLASTDASGDLFRLLFPLSILVLIAVGVPLALILLSRLAHGSRDDAPGKHVPYEGGLPSTVGGADERFSVKFYLIAMLFLVFDLEVAFLYPWAIHFAAGGWEMIWILLAFLVLLEVGYLYLYRKGALDWE